MSSFALPEGLNTVDIKFTLKLGVYRNILVTSVDQVHPIGLVRTALE